MTDKFDTGNTAFIAKRYASERRFRAYGAAALAISVLFLAYVLIDIGIKAWPSFFEHSVVLDINLDPAKIDASNVMKSDFDLLVKDNLRNMFPNVTARADRKALLSLLSVGAADGWTTTALRLGANRAISAAQLASSEAGATRRHGFRL